MYIGIDCGTQGTKAILWQDGAIIGQGYTAHNTLMTNPGQREQSPESWLDALLSSIELAFKGIEDKKSAIKGIGISGQQHGLVLLDKNDQIIRDALLWCDTRPHQVLAEFKQSNDINFVESIGVQVPVAFTIGKLLWVKQHDPDSFRRIRKILLPHDYLNWALTGRYAIEPGDASGTGWFDTRTKTINEQLLSLIGIEGDVERPEILRSHDVVGTLRPVIANRLGLNKNVIVSAGGGDNMMAAIGTGNVSTGQLTISLGTSGTLFSHCTHQVDSHHFPDLNAFCSSTNGYLPLASTMNVTTANNQILNLINQNISEFDLTLNSSPIGANGLQCMPFFNGARLPNVPNANGAILNITATNFSPENLLRATVEGVTLNLQRGANILREAEVKFDSVCVIGGGANSDSWRQMISDVMNVPLWSPASTEAAAVGGAIQACWAYENMYQATEISTISQDVIEKDKEKSVTPDLRRVEKYQQLAEHYHESVDQYVTQFR
ncbi:xylulokinase [Vibrio mediterranei]|uniref:xylulokinase n=1 Tax=Vibrio mediterranei TaxID=689 RepID=UPI004067F5C9